MKLPCNKIPEEFCLANICAECHKLLKTMEEAIPISAIEKALV